MTYAATRHAPFVAYKGTAIKDVPVSPASEFLTGSRADVFELTPSNIYRAVAWVYRCVEIRSHSVSSIPFTLEGESAYIDIDRVQRHLPEMLRRIEAGLCLHGAAYLGKQYNQYGVLTGLQWMASSTVSPRFNAVTGLERFERTLAGGTRSIPVEQMVYLWLPDPDVEMGPGNHPAQVALKAAGIVANSNEFTGGFFERGALNVTLLVVDPTVSEPELKRLEVWWKRMARGVQKAWETIAVRKSVEPKMLGYPPEQLAMPQLKSMARSEIVNAFGVPEAMLTQSANYASAREHRLAYWNDTIVPETQFIEANLNEQLFIPLGLRLKFRFDALSVFQRDEAMEIDGVVTLYNSGLISLNEARARLGMETVGNDTVPGQRPDATPSAPGLLAPDATVGNSPVNPNAVTPAAPGKPNVVQPAAPLSSGRRAFDTSDPYRGRMPRSADQEERIS